MAMDMSLILKKLRVHLNKFPCLILQIFWSFTCSNFSVHNSGCDSLKPKSETKNDNIFQKYNDESVHTN